ncbi:MAG: hypothetical protein ACO3C1_00620 [Ilumatobacteraceae bacterium]
MTAQAWFDEQQYDVAPGGGVVATLTVRNLSTTAGTFSITPLGLAANYATVTPAVVTLFPNEQTEVAVDIRPPLSPSTTAGLTSLAVRVVPHENPDDLAFAETGVEITEFIEQRMSMVQPVVRARRTATFEVTIENNGNRATSLRLHYLEPTSTTEATIEPPSIVVEPGTTGVAEVRVRALEYRRRRTSRAIPFRVQASDAGLPALDAHGTFVHAPIVPEQLRSSLTGAVSVLAAVVLLWFAFLRGVVADVARDAARDVASAGSVTTPPGQVGSAGATPGATGLQVASRLAVTAAVGETAATRYTVPDDKVLHVTDLIVQNPQLDIGTLVILRNTEVLLSYNLANVFSDVAAPLTTPLRFESGDRVEVSFTCAGIGTADTDTCAPAVLLSGVLTD